MMMAMVPQSALVSCRRLFPSLVAMKNRAGGRPTRLSTSGLGSQKGSAWRTKRGLRPIVLLRSLLMRYQRMDVRTILMAESRLRTETATLVSFPGGGEELHRRQANQAFDQRARVAAGTG